MARLFTQRRMVRCLALGIVLIGIAGGFAIVYRTSLQKSRALAYRQGTLEYWLLVPGVLRGVPVIEPIGEKSYLYEYVDEGSYFEVWNELQYRSAGRGADLRRLLDGYLEAEGYVENPDTSDLERVRGDEFSQISYSLEPAAGGIDVIVLHVVIRDLPP